MELLTTTQVAEKLGVTDERVRQICQSGKLKATKFGRDWAITPEALEDYQRRQSENGSNR